MFTFNDETDYTYTDQFDTMGVGSMNLFQNIGSAFFWYNLDFISLFLVVVISGIVRYFP